MDLNYSHQFKITLEKKQEASPVVAVVICQRQPKAAHPRSKYKPPALVAAFVHCCYLMRCHLDIDLESLFSSHSIAQVIDDADEFLSAVSSLSVNVGDDVQFVDLDEFFECPSPNEPLVGS
jgi:hypothetical protein